MSRTHRLLALAALATLAAPAAAPAQEAVFVVRHAEKISDSDQRLTDAGRARAQRLAAMLKDSGVSAIYATDTERARDTAGPLAATLGKPVQIYDELAPLVARLRRENAKELVLVVGHSNTVPDLLKALGDAETVTIASNEYDDLFVVVPKGAGKATVLRLRY